jgi:hemerythrin-like domain-containing protein
MNEPLPSRETRRRFIQQGIVFTASGLLTRTSVHGEEQTKAAHEKVSVNEDLMQEHGVLNRVLIIYEEIIQRLSMGAEVPPEAVRNSAEIVRSYVEDYHEKLEQDFLFPRFINANVMKDLVQVLIEQHLGGRNLTDIVLRLATEQTMKNNDDRVRLIESLRKFIRMYHAHEAREDTVLFPAFRGLISAHEYGALLEDFAKRERELFGGECFPEMVGRVAAIERQLGIAELSRFTEGF